MLTKWLLILVGSITFVVGIYLGLRPSPTYIYLVLGVLGSVLGSGYVVFSGDWRETKTIKAIAAVSVAMITGLLVLFVSLFFIINVRGE